MSRFALIAWLLLLHAAKAEYRTALLIGEGLEASAGALEQAGFRCRTAAPPNTKELKRAIEGWVNTTPTQGTALLVFKGKTGMSKELLLQGADGRGGVSLREMFEILGTRGGSKHHLLYLDVPETPAFDVETPESFRIQRGTIGALPGNLKLSGAPSKALSPPDRFVLGKKAGDEWMNAHGMIFVWCPPGSYTAGSAQPRFPDEAQREVVIKDGFWIGKYELTMRENPRNKNSRIANGKKNHPLTGVHWDDGKTMLIRNLTQAEQEAGRLPTDWQYSLPTPEQWEYAARAGGKGEWHFGDALDPLPRYANFSDKAHWDSGDLFGNSAHRTLDDGFAGFAPVGSFAPNAWGLHDVHGNIGEWLINHELRGGSYISPPANTRLAYKVRYSSRDNQVYTGYRVVIQKTPPEKPKP